MDRVNPDQRSKASGSTEPSLFGSLDLELVEKGMTDRTALLNMPFHNNTIKIVDEGAEYITFQLQWTFRPLSSHMENESFSTKIMFLKDTSLSKEDQVAQTAMCAARTYMQGLAMTNASNRPLTTIRNLFSPDSKFLLNLTSPSPYPKGILMKYLGGVSPLPVLGSAQSIILQDYLNDLNFIQRIWVRIKIFAMRMFPTQPKITPYMQEAARTMARKHVGTFFLEDTKDVTWPSRFKHIGKLQDLLQEVNKKFPPSEAHMEPLEDLLTADQIRNMEFDETSEDITDQELIALASLMYSRKDIRTYHDICAQLRQDTIKLGNKLNQLQELKEFIKSGPFDMQRLAVRYAHQNRLTHNYRYIAHKYQQLEHDLTRGNNDASGDGSLKIGNKNVFDFVKDVNDSINLVESMDPVTVTNLINKSKHMSQETAQRLLSLYEVFLDN